MDRLQKFRENIKTLDIDGMLITNPENRRYLSGFTGSAGILLISVKTAAIMTDFRYWEQAAGEVTNFILYKQGPDLWQSILQLIQELHWNKIGFEAGSLTFKEYQFLCGSAPKDPKGLQFVPLSDLVEKQRWVKDEQEIATIAVAAAITDRALAKTLSIIKPGLKERQLALEFDYQLRLQGAAGNAFTTIAISGERTSLPHGAASEKEIAEGDLVLIDCGALYQGYCADLTRTMVVGTASAEQKRLYQIVLQGQEIALNYLKAGLVGSEVDKVTRDFLTRQGYGENFGHGLGHSVGLNIHESPRLSMTERNHIPAGAVVTVEPGVYLPGWGGIRIEDLVVVDETGIRNLTHSPKRELIEL